MSPKCHDELCAVNEFLANEFRSYEAVKYRMDTKVVWLSTVLLS